jgi:beta-glucanase (GH16 family)
MTIKMNRFFRAVFVVLVLMLWTACDDSTGPEDDKWQLVWQDEFDGPAGQLPEASKWDFDIGTGWGNAQLEYDTNRPENVSLDGNGNLAIIARKEAYMGQGYTSARINTRDLFEPTYGRFEARMKLPWGQGIWPAFWLLGANEDVDGWPACGEIDIMEYRGQEPSRVHGSLHGPGYSGSEPVTDRYNLYDDRFDTGFHVFAVEWGADYIKWYVDDDLYQTVSPENVPGTWVFDHPFFIILNLAVGGNYVGPPNESTVFPQTMLVDYVRVYEEAE